jgi:uncharacterized membrane protein
MNLKKRFWEVDFLRGIAILMMVLFHVISDLFHFANFRFIIYSGFWRVFAHVTATIFIFLVGVSLSLSFERSQLLKKINFTKYLKRGLKIFMWGLLITLMTWLFYQSQVVVFGVLHLIGIAIILAYPFLKLKYWNLGIGSVLVLIGIYLYNLKFNFSFLIWLGFLPQNTYPADYFPVLPWFGVVLIGIFVGKILYSNYKRNFKLPDLSNFSLIKFFRFLGRHSLLIYLIHQPILIGIIYLLGL